MTKACKHCGATNDDGANFCRVCGGSWGEMLVRSATPLSAVAAKWRLLRTNTTRNEVRKLLGEPARIDTEDERVCGSCEMWTYEYVRAGPVGGDAATSQDPVTGFVRILSAESRVIEWSEPDWPRMEPDR